MVLFYLYDLKTNKTDNITWYPVALVHENTLEFNKLKNKIYREVGVNAVISAQV